MRRHRKMIEGKVHGIQWWRARRNVEHGLNFLQSNPEWVREKALEEGCTCSNCRFEIFTGPKGEERFRLSHDEGCAIGGPT